MIHGELHACSGPEEQARIIRNPVASEEDENTFTRTRRLSRAATEICDDWLQPFGVSAVQFSPLEVIDRLAPTTRADIARNQKLDKSTLTRDLKSIFSEGLVEEVRQGANGRSGPIALTPVRKQLLRRAGGEGSAFGVASFQFHPNPFGSV